MPKTVRPTPDPFHHLEGEVGTFSLHLLSCPTCTFYDSTLDDCILASYHPFSFTLDHKNGAIICILYSATKEVQP